MTPKHPIQPIYLDEQRTLRFKQNSIVRFLLDRGGFDLNFIAQTDFPREDRVQFAQLIGYSLDGFGELSYVNDYDYLVAQKTCQDKNISEKEARIEVLEKELADLKELLRKPIARLYGIHPDDLR